MQSRNMFRLNWNIAWKLCQLLVTQESLSSSSLAIRSEVEDEQRSLICPIVNACLRLRPSSCLVARNIYLNEAVNGSVEVHCIRYSFNLTPYIAERF